MYLWAAEQISDVDSLRWHMLVLPSFESDNSNFPTAETTAYDTSIYAIEICSQVLQPTKFSAF